MPAVPVPPILNQLAMAGTGGMSLLEASPARRDLELCQAWGFPLLVRDNQACLSPNADMLVPALIEMETPCISWNRLSVLGFLEIGSTNDEALCRVRQGAEGGLLVYAEKQTSGRGRKGRPWISPPREGLYFTLVVRPRRPLEAWPLLTHVTSVALVQTLNDLTFDQNLQVSLKIDIKWPNDVLLSGRKVAGILLETARSSDSGLSAVVGVGMNVGRDSVPEELRKQATSISLEAGVRVPRRRLLVRFLYFFQLNYQKFQHGQDQEILDLWKAHSSMWDGVAVWIIEAQNPRPAVTCGLTEFGALKIRGEDGREEILLAADVSLRLV